VSEDGRQCGTLDSGSGAAYLGLLHSACRVGLGWGGGEVR
jgi:hypothetical protein